MIEQLNVMERSRHFSLSIVIVANEIIPLLKRYQLLLKLMRELVIDQAIADINYTDEELTAIHQAMVAGRSSDVENDENVAFDI